MQNTPKNYKNKIITIPNVLSFLRILMVPVIVWLYWVKESALGTAAMLTVSGLTDVVDGYIARNYNMISDFGKAFDPVADKLTQFSMMVCLVAKHPLIITPLILLTVKEICTGIMGLIAIKKTGEVKSADWHGKLTTCTIYALIIIHLLWIEIPKLVSFLCVTVCTAMMLISFGLYSYKYLSAIKNKSK